jgi:hypothetical protein
MSKPKHTPGPWQADGFDVRQPAGRYVAYAGPHHTPSGEYPASCANEDRANALLIAAAPDMLEALEWADQILADDFYYPDEFPRSLILSVIAKAKGESA